MKIKYEKKDKYTTEDLLEIMTILRGPRGCPWDRAQNHDSIKQNLLEESYEVIDAIDSGQKEKIVEELGDILLQVVFHSKIGEDNGIFDYTDIVTGICKKLISRHTHIFETDDVSMNSSDIFCEEKEKKKEKKSKAAFEEQEQNPKNPQEVLDIWEKNKAKEKNTSSITEEMIEIPCGFPALMRAYKIQNKAAKCGFDWDDIADVRNKIFEELEETTKAGTKSEKEEELGDLLFAVVNYSRFLQVDPEISLDKANKKFISRFGKLERYIKDNKLEMGTMTIQELDEIWEMVKDNEIG